MKRSTRLLVPVTGTLLLLISLALWWSRPVEDSLASEGLTRPPQAEVVSRPPEDLTPSKAAERAPATPSLAEEIDALVNHGILPPKEEQGLATLTGRIVDMEGKPFGHGTVLIYANGGKEEVLTSVEVEALSSTFEVELLAKARYWLRIDPESLPGGYLPSVSGFRRESASEAGPVKTQWEYSFNYVELKPGDEAHRELQVGLPGILRGRLLDKNGDPLPGALARVDSLEGQISGLSYDCTTDDHGLFVFEEVFPGPWRLKFSRAEAWTPPVSSDHELRSGESMDLGDFRAGEGWKVIRGRVVDQDGEAFSGLKVLCYSNQAVAEGLRKHDWGSALGRTTTDEDGRFELTGLPEIPVKVGLTSQYSPGRVEGHGHPAYWEPPVEVDLTESGAVVDVGTHVVEESRPYELRVNVLFDAGWLEGFSNARSRLGCTLTPVEGETLPSTVRRTALRETDLRLEKDADVFLRRIETPSVGVEVRLRLQGHEELVFTVRPEPDGAWEQEVRVPEDFTPK